MIVEIYLDEGEVAITKIEIEEGEDEGKAMQNLANNMLNQIKETGFTCMPNDGGYHMINVYNIDEIRIVPDEK